MATYSTLSTADGTAYYCHSTHDGRVELWTQDSKSLLTLTPQEARERFTRPRKADSRAAYAALRAFRAFERGAHLIQTTPEQAYRAQYAAIVGVRAWS